MRHTNHRKHRSPVRVVIYSLIVHLVFILQLTAALARHGLVLRQFGYFFFPHTLLMYFLPPRFSFATDSLDAVRIMGKILDAAPASLLYGLAASYVVQLIADRLRKPAADGEVKGKP
jgi:hypothetical protein